MTEVSERLENERKHGVFLSQNPEAIWGHASLAGRLRVQRRVDLFKDLADLRPGKRICEIGCGTGVFTKELLSRTGVTIVGVDVSPELTKLAEGHVKDPRVTFIVGDCMDPETMNAPLEFDAVVTNSVLHHLDVPKALPAILKMLKPGGVFVCSEPNMMNPQIAVQKNVSFVKRWAGDSPDETAFFRCKLAKQMTTEGFVDVKIEPFDFLHPRVPDAWAEGLDGMLRRLEKILLIKEISGSLIIFGRKSL
ncbi:MAG: class I SAM-dependent methyltransferase [Patescibacteria group bacterium]|nr:class I SAM-dependent methyltransferase [Patescibacteria group bacterium]